MKIENGILRDVSEKDIENGRFTIPDGATSIGKYAFSECCESLVSITIPKSVTSIECCAFRHCVSLKSITIPASVTSIGWFAFNDCPKLKSIIVSKRNKVYHSSGNCLIETATKTLIFGLKNSIIPEDGSVTRIGDYAFDDCIKLKSITIPDSVTSIGDHAFCGCTALASITIPNSVTSIGDYAFCGCTALASITIPDSVTNIGWSAFSYCISLLKKGKFKATDKNMWCRDFKYEIGKPYHEDKAILCERGFHYCENAFDLFNYYYGEIGKDIRFFKVETSGMSYETGDDSKRVCTDITFMEEIKSYKDLLN